MKSALAGVAGLRLAALLLGTIASILVARELGPAGYGQLAILLAVLNLLSIPSNNAIVPLLIREVSADQQNADPSRLKGLLTWSLRLSAAVCIPAALLLGIWAGWLFVTGSSAEAYLYLLAAPLLFLWAGAARVSGILRGFNRVVLAQAFDWLLNPILYLSLILFIFLTNQLSTANVLGSMVIAAGISMTAGTLVMRHQHLSSTQNAPARAEHQRWLNSWRSFLLLQTLSVINLRAPVLLLGTFGTDADAGLYRVADNIATMLSLTMLVMNTVIGPRLARLYATGDLEALGRLTRNAARGALSVTLPVALLIVVFGEELLSLIFGGQYTQAYTAMIVLILGQLISTAAGSVGLVLNMTGHEQHAVPIWILVVLLNLGAGVALIPFYGATGAAVAAAVSTIAWNLLLLLRTRKLVGISTAVY